MVSIPSLWLPILVSAVFVFIASSIIHMMLRYHYTDMKKLPDETGVADALRKLTIPDGHYFLPHAADMKEMKTPEFKEKMTKGPNGILTIWSGGNPGMTKFLVQWFVFCLVVGVLAAYVAGRALGPGAEFLSVLRFAGVMGFACYTVAGYSESIWYRRPWSVSLKNTIDGLVYGVLTGLAFGWLWPS